MKLCGIYLLTNIETGKKYIGQSVDIKGRWRAHAKSKADTPISRPIQKHGWESFNKEVLLLCDPEHLDERECAYISMHDTICPSGYNLKGGGGQIHRQHEITRQKMSASHKGRPKSEEHRRNIGLAHKGRKQSPEFIARRKANGVRMSDEGRARVAEFARNRKITEETREKLRKSSQRNIISKETRLKMAASNRGQKRSGSALENIAKANAGRTPEQKAAAAAKQRATRAAKKLLRQVATITAAGDLFAEHGDRQEV